MESTYNNAKSYMSYKRDMLRAWVVPLVFSIYLPLMITFNKTLSNIKNVIDKYIYILSINKKLFISYRRDKNKETVKPIAN